MNSRGAGIGRLFCLQAWVCYNTLMSETSLYRKYRPQKFSDVIGQDDVVKVLESAIAQKKIAHAYLFAGSRGTGKTSLARIFAREIGTSPNDLYEIDAASNRGIDDIRALREGVTTLPFESKFKVYIVDEVHMLTKEAFNALLKTLEEPPAHAVFILATTETDKLPETVVSRCQVFSFRKPSQQVLKSVVLSVAKKEGFDMDSGSAELVALLGDGSFRDTLGMLQKVLSTAKSTKISAEEVEQITGAPRHELVADIVDGIALKDINKALHAVREAAGAGVDMRIFFKLILEKLRFILLLRISKDKDIEVHIKGSVSPEEFHKIQGLAAAPGSNITSGVLLELLAAYDLVGRSFILELPLELALANILAPEGK